MPIYCCNKLAKGKVKFEIDWDNQQIRLLEDFPESDGKGAIFSSEWVKFENINNAIKEIGHGGKFALCFKNDSSNNKSMLAAILNALGCIDSKYNMLSLLTPNLQEKATQYLI